MSKALTDIRLDNGLQVILKEIHTAPLISHWLWYRVGSRNEIPGKTGLSHWVEHMQFKGTAKRSARAMDTAISKTGGYWNAFTSEDWTTYFETLPSDALDLSLAIESDRMQGSLFLPEEVETERTVILSEREGNENDPTFLLEEAVQSAAYHSHPYRNEVLGSKEDLLTITRDDLYAHYQNAYAPGNAVLCLAGDFETKTALQKIEKRFGKIPAKAFHTHTPMAEPELPEFKKIEVHGPGETPFLRLTYRCPKASDPDFFALTILDSVLAGPSSLNMFGSGGITNRSSRLYLSLVDKALCASVSGGLNANIDPGSYNLHFTANASLPLSDLLEAIDEQLELIRTRPLSVPEIQKAQKQAKALFAYGSDNITNQAFWMGYASMFDEYAWFLNYVDSLGKITPEDLIRVANKYLDPQHRVIGAYLPNQEASA